ncbi:hypothetical protein DFH27DRAFT_578750 [Peziza echinospora]|nr:hypothetical protein DFH27DRAFT_578750 [Peziza echinospora]
MNGYISIPAPIFFPEEELAVGIWNGCGDIKIQRGAPCAQPSRAIRALSPHPSVKMHRPGQSALPWALLLLIASLAAIASALSITGATVTQLGTDPEGSARLNGGSFQQDAITTHNGYQYAAWYVSTGTYAKQNLAVSRRQLPSGAWQHAQFADYVQTTIDGHNTISMGISTADGRIHLSYDHHDVPLNYRVSQAGVASNPGSYTWGTNLFGSTLHALPGAPAAGPWTPLTYPRFERGMADGGLLMEFRIGQSGAGDSYIYQYNPAASAWAPIGKYLQGANNNAYLNGLDYANGRLHATWTWRETPDVVTNHDLAYAYSDDLGKTWRNGAGAQIAVAGGQPITPSASGINAFTIPQNSGILNQEAQTVDASGRVHVLNRESRDGGFKWYHYWRNTNGAWTRNVLALSNVGTPTATGLRGKVFSTPAGDLLLLLPNNNSGAAEINIWAATAGGQFKDWKFLWKQTGVDTEPLLDRWRLKSQGDNVLSIFARGSGAYGTRKDVVIDFKLGN